MVYLPYELLQDIFHSSDPYTFYTFPKINLEKQLAKGDGEDVSGTSTSCAKLKGMPLPSL